MKDQVALVMPPANFEVVGIHTISGDGYFWNWDSDSKTYIRGKRDCPYEVNVEDLTVYHIDEHGEKWDLNAEGQPIESVNELIEFIHELREQNCISSMDRIHLLADIEPHV